MQELENTNTTKNSVFSALATAKLEKRYRYQRSGQGAYRDWLISDLRKAIEVAMYDDLKQNRDALNQTKMVRFNRRKQLYELRFGYGKRCIRIDIPELPADEIATFYDVETLKKALEELLKRTIAGEYDEVLEAKRLQSQALGDHMVSFRSKPKKVNDNGLNTPIVDLPKSAYSETIKEEVNVSEENSFMADDFLPQHIQRELAEHFEGTDDEPETEAS